MKRLLRFLLHVSLLAGVLVTVPWFVAAATAATGDTVVPPPAPDAVAAYLTAYGPIVGILTVTYLLGGWALRTYASAHWLAQGKRLAYLTAVLGLAGTALQALVSGTPVSGVVITAVLGLAHIADAQMTEAPAQKQGTASGTVKS
jgi:hypothetical protein